MTAGRRSTISSSTCRSSPGDSPRRSAAAQAAGRSGEILVVGVGTGLELPLLPATTRVTGVDLSRAMLDVARRRVARHGLAQVKRSREMDAQALSFADAAFDVALAPYVMSVVPDPAKALDEMWRVTRPGGELVLINHFAAERGWRVGVETAMEGAAAWLGWQPRFPFAAVGDWLAAQPAGAAARAPGAAAARHVHAGANRQPA